VNTSLWFKAETTHSSTLPHLVTTQVPPRDAEPERKKKEEKKSMANSVVLVRLYPTPAQKAALKKMAGGARFTYNQLLTLADDRPPRQGQTKEEVERFEEVKKGFEEEKEKALEKWRKEKEKELVVEKEKLETLKAEKPEEKGEKKAHEKERKKAEKKVKDQEKKIKDQEKMMKEKEADAFAWTKGVLSGTIKVLNKSHEFLKDTPNMAQQGAVEDLLEARGLERRKEKNKGEYCFLFLFFFFPVFFFFSLLFSLFFPFFHVLLLLFFFNI